MNSINIRGAGILALLLIMPGYAAAQDEDTTSHDVLHDRLEARRDSANDALGDQYAALLERLRNADLRPAQKRRIYNALLDNLHQRRDRVDDRLRRIHDRAHDRRRDVRPDVRPEVRPDARPDVRPVARPDLRPDVRPDPRPAVRPNVAPRPGTPGRTPTQAVRGLTVARNAVRQ